jgi:hypothetical protein
MSTIGWDCFTLDITFTTFEINEVIKVKFSTGDGGSNDLKSFSFKGFSITSFDLLTGGHAMILILVKQCWEFPRMINLTTMH